MLARTRRWRPVYEALHDRLLEATRRLKVGTAHDDDFGPVINESQMTTMLASIDCARQIDAREERGGS